MNLAFVVLVFMIIISVQVKIRWQIINAPAQDKQKLVFLRLCMRFLFRLFGNKVGQFLD